MADWDADYSSLFGPAIAAATATYASPPQPPTAALPAASYVGSYGNDYVGEATVTADGETLTVRLGPDGVTAWPLTHFDRDIFLYHDAPEMPDMPSAARFAVGPDGRATALTLESLDSNGLGTLTRR